MTHLLIVSDAAGKELGRVLVGAGYTTREVQIPKKPEADAALDKHVAAGDAGAGTEEVK
jgi:hypothetical protein